VSDCVTGEGISFEVTLTDAGPVKGVILSDHLKSLDWKERRARFATTVAPAILAEVRQRIRPLLGL
jgi:mRNA interferase MazF